jgi:Mannose-6-phosphate isomerase
MNSITEKPWGSFEILKSGKKFLVKKIFVKPGGVLSLQSHEHRSEHWIVAEGEAEVTIDKKVINLKENENIFIPKGAIHRMANRKDHDLVIIEMWYGHNLDENDIKRHEDIYERI